MEDKQRRSNEQVRQPYGQEPGELVQNPNPKANENIRVRTDEPASQNNEPSHGVGSEITDGEDALKLVLWRIAGTRRTNT